MDSKRRPGEFTGAQTLVSCPTKNQTRNRFKIRMEGSIAAGMRDSADKNWVQCRLLTSDFDGAGEGEMCLSDPKIIESHSRSSTWNQEPILSPDIRQKIEERGVDAQRVEEELRDGNFDYIKQLLGQSQDNGVSGESEEQAQSIVDQLIASAKQMASKILGTNAQAQDLASLPSSAEQNEVSAIVGKEKSSFDHSDLALTPTRSDREKATKEIRPKIYGVTVTAIPYLGGAGEANHVPMMSVHKNSSDVGVESMRVETRLSRSGCLRLRHVGIFAGHHQPGTFQIAHRRYQKWFAVPKHYRLARATPY